ncbi:MAG: UDP-N-acetylmuramoyl-L-alanyl-D-glutamate--2,6-diaminopimelate ligase [Rickettsiaceae bacterium]|nr:MAG: UDP-N-acetylmuramoyl-L-alanyl-D-glutamate--2,6-diaminopimelate ligase [Rickettsiaceae bacterium]
MKYELKKIFEQYSIKEICQTSKKIQPGQAFFAVAGTKLNGNDFIAEALTNGAKIVITDQKLDNEIQSDNIFQVEDIKIALSEALNILYPNLPGNLVAVTGTNGKTSVVSYCHQLLELLAQKKSATIGTLGVTCSNAKLNKLFEDESYQSLTTPDIISFYKIMNILADNDVEYTTFEASSHGIAQNRLGNIEVKVAAFTSFSQDHLDYHQNMEQYLSAKLQIFANNLAKDGIAIISSEIVELELIKSFLDSKNIKYLTVGNKGDLKINACNQSISGQIVNFSWLGKTYSFTTEIIGSFQASNLLISALIVNHLGFSFETIISQLHMLKAAEGRLERITKVDDSFSIFVDYSHTPDALDKSLSELRKILSKAGKLYVVFGCGGDRDPSKRKPMGLIAAQIADVVVITDDNPRHENPEQIRVQILSGTDQANEIANRKKAIDFAIKKLLPQDILLIAGKGHEKYQIIGDLKIPFDDRQVAKAILDSICK